MKIAVCIKRVPDTETRIKVAGTTKIDEAGVKFIANPYDEFAVEAALQLKQKAGGEIVAVSLGPDSAQETIRTALAMGADRGLHLKTDGQPYDTLAVAHALAAELKGYDVILLGKMAIDDYNHAMGPALAELLGLPCVSAVISLTIDGAKGAAEREVEGGVEVLSFPLPAVITTDKGLNKPRLPTLPGIMAAKKKPMESKPAALGTVRVTVRSLALPPERPAGRIIGEGAAAVPELIRLLQTEAKVL
ncbi:MAG TPA: electron transfer flavoprotein subunit beta/FixA family protein [Gemmatimonadaceae bacterium]|jgi:electron transfer flavoprotein beta subunit|nr:electron transfer flavoprotein subunit beta/FixA family protein [Gemmatimonadaceae bacterium]